MSFVINSGHTQEVRNCGNCQGQCQCDNPDSELMGFPNSPYTVASEYKPMGEVVHNQANQPHKDDMLGVPSILPPW